MGHPHHHIRHRGRRFGGGGGSYPVYVESYDPEPDEFVPVLVVEKPSNAGDFLPTLVGPDAARKYIDQVDADYTRLNLAVTTSATVSPTFQAQWAVQFAGWKAFSVGARASVGFLDTTSVMGQTDRWAAQLVDFSKSFVAAGGVLVGPAPAQPGQGIPSSSAPSVSDFTKLAIAVGAVAAVFIFGPHISRHI